MSHPFIPSSSPSPLLWSFHPSPQLDPPLFSDTGLFLQRKQMVILRDPVMPEELKQAFVSSGLTVNKLLTLFLEVWAFLWELQFKDLQLSLKM